VRRLAAPSSILLAVALLAPASAQACSCAAIAPETRLAQSDGAVIAKLIEVLPRGRYLADYRYRIKEAFKARRRLRPGRLLTIRAPVSSATCGLPHDRRGSYGLFLRRSRGRWHAGLCDVVSGREMREAAAGRAGARARSCSA
jgi:hypothetical protein